MDIGLVEHGKSELCRAILMDLREWFGIPSAVDTYVREAEALDLLAARDSGTAIGFLTLKEHFGATVEIRSMGVLKRFHRTGIGTGLMAGAERFARDRGVSFLSVKTLSPASSDPNYAVTRAFYAACGFVPIEELPTLWGPENPCLLMAKSLG